MKLLITIIHISDKKTYPIKRKRDEVACHYDLICIIISVEKMQEKKTERL